MTAVSSPVKQAQRALKILSGLSYRTGKLQDYLEAVVQGISALLSLDWSVVTLCEANSERILASNLDIGEAMNQVYPLHGTLTGAVVAQGCPITVADTTRDQTHGQGVEGYRAYLGVPLRLPTGTVIGTICSFQTRSRAFSAEEVKLAELFAERAAIAIDNYQLFQQQQQLNASLQAEIAERKAAETALRLSENRFRTLVEQATDAFYVIGSDLRILDVNRQACQRLGYDRETLLTLTLPDIQTAFEPDRLHQLLAQIAPGQPVTVEGQHRREDGQIFPVEISIAQIELAGQMVYLGLARDISDRKQAEADRERLAEIGELAAMIVHEVRNPLTTVWMAITAMRSEALSARSAARLSLAVEEAERLQTLLNDILLYAKPEQNLACCEIELNAWLGELIEQLRPQGAIASRRIDWQPAAADLVIQADSNKLKQVFINLITNACEATAAGEAVRCWVESAADYLKVHVHNGGAPIPPEVLPQLTRPFFTTKSTGNGLGLAITKRIVEAHAGQLSITSEAIAGTQVSISLPYSL
ncbi:MAG: PAS domain S-box protein [Leptolyngbya sp. SIO4C1]|nr:PAS domain S-box protein [Leptolyngbya sp. SIO4C1]